MEKPFSIAIVTYAFASSTASRSGRPQQVLLDLLQGQLDCALYADTVAPSLKGYEITPCYRVPIVLALAPGHPLGANRRLSVEDLAGQRLLTSSSSALRMSVCAGASAEIIGRA